MTAWKGISGSSQINGQRLDYERACETKAYLQAISVGSAKALILGDEPMQSAFVTSNTGELRIARWMAASSYEAAETLVRAVGTQLVEAGPAVHFNVAEQELCMFDSSATWTQDCGTAARCRVRPGGYIVTTERLTDLSRASFIIHRFLQR